MILVTGGSSTASGGLWTVRRPSLLLVAFKHAHAGLEFGHLLPHICQPVELVIKLNRLETQVEVQHVAPDGGQVSVCPTTFADAWRVKVNGCFATGSGQAAHRRSGPGRPSRARRHQPAYKRCLRLRSTFGGYGQDAAHSLGEARHLSQMCSCDRRHCLGEGHPLCQLHLPWPPPGQRGPLCQAPGPCSEQL